MNKNSKIYVAGHRGLVGSAIVRNLQERGYTNIIGRTHKELDLTRQSDVEKFFEVVDQCKGTVELVSPEGDRINLKSKLAQYLSMATIFSNGYIKELDLIAHEKEDIERLIKYMYQGE